MSGYLQRLYDAGGAPAGAVALRPAQRSHSPLIAADQRLTRPEFAANFEFGATPEADGDAYGPLDAPEIGIPAPVAREVPRREQPVRERTAKHIADFVVQPVVGRVDAPQLRLPEEPAIGQPLSAVVERTVHTAKAFAAPVPKMPVLTPSAPSIAAQTALAPAQPLPQTGPQAERGSTSAESLRGATPALAPGALFQLGLIEELRRIRIAALAEMQV